MTYNANNSTKNHGSVVEMVRKAIDESTTRTRIVDLRPSTQEEMQAMCAELETESEGSTDSNEGHEYWGADVDGREWRVRVRQVA